jgi:hypothetical protein
MSAAEVLAPEISEPLTWVEICTRYPDEWVCLVEMDRVHPFGFEFRSARVVGHGKTRRAPIEQAMRWRSHYDSIARWRPDHCRGDRHRATWGRERTVRARYGRGDDHDESRACGVALVQRA